MKKKAFLMLILFVTWHGVQARQKERDKKPSVSPSPIDLTKSLDSAMKAKNKIVEYDKVVTKDAVVKKGLLNLILTDDKYYLEIPEKVLKKEILVVNRIGEGASGLANVYAGDDVNELVISFSLSKDKKNVYVSKRNYNVKALKPGDQMYENVKRSNAEPISYVWPVKTVSPDSARVVEITQLLETDEDLFGFDSKLKSQLKIGSPVFGASSVNGWKTFPNNVSFRVSRTYGSGAGGGFTAMSAVPGLPGAGAASGVKYTMELNSSWILLPENQMRLRDLDDRVGYFWINMVDFNQNPHGIKNRTLATRWRLEPKPEDVQRYLAGELVEPVKPIIFYIDPTTPEKWIPYLIKGVNDWQRSFEKAGFKNAIIAKRAPTKEEDPEWSLEDTRYSAIVYKPSEIPNASGPHVGDPRTGEILESHINWYHNVMLILDNWFLAQVGAVDPRARKYEIDDDLMGELIRFVSSHEVGHTLGLRHNFIASNATPVELLRNKAWVEKNGHTSSIMDYARFNYVAQPEDNIGPEGLYPRVNDYDDWAINWGYRWFGNISQEQEQRTIDQMTTEAIKNPRLRWLAGVEYPGIPDPRAQTEDLGDNQMKANTYGIKNLQYIASHLPEWKVKKGDDYQKLFAAYYQGVVMQYFNYIKHAATYIGGVYGDSYTATDGAPNNYKPAPVALQKEALTFIDRWLFHSQNWLFNDENILGKFDNPAYRAIGILLSNKFREMFMDDLLNVKTLAKMETMNIRFGQKSYQIADYLKDIQNKIWSDLQSGGKIDAYRQSVQNEYLKKMAILVKPTPPGLMDELKNNPMFKQALGQMGMDKPAADAAKALSIINLEQLKNQINGALKSGKFTDALTKAHLNMALKEIDSILSAK